MANNTINVDLKLRSNISNTTADAEDLNSQLSSATKNVIAYNRAAAIGGSSARDFSKEAEGLGGIVRSYAIIAANVYAVSSAFKVLSDAMDTTIMVKSMDILGARSGIALGSLSKELVKVSDGALSLRESMEVVSKGTAAGITANQLRDLTKVAGNASRALGLNMPDAMSRLIRGTSKLEPELLDELGIFTKIEPAVNEYARSLGKSASSLTDFEKRQAFLVATIKEGAEKYKDLEEAGTNAYTRLSAVLKDTLQASLENINSILVPVIDFLSKSPTALYGVLAGIGALLIKQIIPAIAQLSAGLERSVNIASIEAVSKVTRIQKAIQDRTEKASIAAIAASESEADAKVAAVDRVEKKLKSLQRRGGALTPGVQEIVSQVTPATDITKEKALELRQEIRKSNLSKQDRRVQYEYVSSLEKSRDAEKALTDAIAQKTDAMVRAQEQSRSFKNEQIVANRALQRSAQQMNLSQVAETTRNLGILEGFRAGMEDIQQRRAGPVERNIPTGERDKSGELITKTVTVDKLGRVGQAVETIKVAAVAGTQAVSSFLSAFSPWLMVIGLLAPLLGVLHDKFVGNIKDIEATNDAYSKLDDGIKSAYKTIEFLGKNSSRLLSIENLSAASTALETIGTDLEDFTRKAQRELASGSWWYGLVEGAQKLVGFGTEKSISKALLNSFDSAVQLSISNSEPMRKELAKVLQLPEDATFASIRLAAEKADPDTQMKFAQALKQIGTNAQAAVQPTKDLLEAFTQTGKVFDNIISSVLPSSGLAKWAYDGLINMQGFRKEIGDVATDIGALNNLVKNPGELIKKFGIEGSKAIRDLVPEVQRLNKEYTETINKLGDVDKAVIGSTDKEIAMARERVKNLQESAGKKQTDNFLPKEELSQAEARLARLIKFKEDKLTDSEARKPLLGVKADQEKQISDIFNKFTQASAAATKEFGRLFEVELGNSAAKANLSISKAMTGYVQDIGVKAKLELANTQEEIRIEKDKIKTTVDLIRAMELNRIELARNSNGLAQRSLAEEKGTDEEKAQRKKQLTIEARSLDIRQAQVEGKDSKKAYENLQQGAYIPSRGGPGVPAVLEIEQAAQQMARSATSPVLLSMRAAEGQAAQLDANLKIAKDRATIEGTINDVYSKRSKALEDEVIALNNNKKEILNIGGSQEDVLSKTNEIDAKILQTQNKQKEVQAEQVVAVANFLAYLNKGNSLYEQNLTSVTSILERLRSQNSEGQRVAVGERNRAETLKQIDESYKNVTNEQQNQSTLLESNRRLEDAGIEASKLKFEAEASLGKFTAQQLQDRRAQIALDEVNLNQIRQQDDAQTSLISKATQLGQALAKAVELNDLPEQQRILSQINAATTAYGTNVDAINKVTEAKRENIRVTNSLSVQEKAFADIFTKGFESMADAMAEFVKTGKLDFKSLINSMIMDLIRFQLRSQMQELAGPGGGANFFAKLLSGALGSGSPTYNTGGQSLPGSFNPENAKGGVYSSSGIEKFAMGGAFTNSIVNTPTLFKFANGTGLMGEAGPEAIMPLKRDSSGTLGVRSSQQKVDIVVNNYSGQKAETRETTDSRGNRKIEVVVGEMTAGDISKPGSSSQQALRSNYGLQPALIRR